MTLPPASPPPTGPGRSPPPFSPRPGSGSGSGGPARSAGIPAMVGRYAVTAELGRGGMGVVVRGHDPALRRDVAIKLLGAGSSDRIEPRLLERFAREARAAARLRHPGIVSVHEVGEQAGRPFIVMDFVDGSSLEDLLSERRPDARRVAEIVRDLARALEHAHRAGVLHRDVKPQNVLVDDAGGVHLTDFGLARDLDADDATLTRSGQLVGTPQYLAPEQARGEGVRPPVDVYGVGGVLYRALVGRPPFEGTSLLEILHQVFRDDPVAPRRLDARIPRDLETIALRCLEKAPDRRYPDAGALAADLDRFLAGEPIAARPVGRGERALRWAARHRAFAATIGLGGAALVALAVGAGVVVSRSFAAIRDATEDATDAQARAEDEAARAREALGRARTAEAEARRESDAAKLAIASADARLAEVLVEIADGAMDAREAAAAWTLLARANALAPSPAARWRLLEARAESPRLRFQSPSLHTANAIALAFTGDGGLVGFSGGSFTRWRATTGEAAPFIATRGVSPSLAGRPRFSPSGRLLATPSSKASISVIDATTGALVRDVAVPGLVASLTEVAISPDDALLAVASKAGLDLWRIETGERIEEPDDAGPATAVAWRADGRAIALARGASVSVIPIGASGAPDRSRASVLDAGAPATALALSSDGAVLAIGTGDGRVRIVATAGSDDAEPVDGTPFAGLGRAASIELVAFVEGGLVTSNGAAIALVDLTTGRTVGRWIGSNTRTGVAVAHDGRTFAHATHSTGRRLVVRDAAGLTVRALEGHNSIDTARLDPSGRVLASTGDRVLLWDARTGALITALSEDPSTFHGDVAWSGDGTLAVPDRNGMKLFRRDESGGWSSVRLPWTPVGHAGVAFSPDGARIAIAHSYRDEEKETRGMVTVHDVASGEALATLGYHHVAPGQVAWSPDGRWIMTRSGADRLKLWEASTGEEIGPSLIPQGIVKKAMGAAFSPDGERLAFSQGGFVHIWDLATRRAAAVLDPPATGDPAGELAWSPDGRWLATGSLAGHARGRIYVWDAESGEVIHAIPGHASAIGHLSFGPDGELVATSVNEIRIWDLPDRPRTGPIAALRKSVGILAFDAIGARLAIGSSDGKIHLYDLEARRVTRTLDTGRDQVRSLLFVPERGAIVLGDPEGVIRSWIVDGPNESVEVLSSSETLRSYSLAITPSGELAVSHTRKGQIIVHDVESGDELLRVGDVDFPGAPHRLTTSLTFDPDGDRLAVGGIGGISIIDPRGGVILERLVARQSRNAALAWSPDGTRLASGGKPRIRIWDVAASRELGRLEPDEVHDAAGGISSLAWRGNRIASAAGNRIARVWDAASHEEWLRITRRGTTASPRSVAFHPRDADRLAIGWSDGVVMLLETEPLARTPDELVEEARAATRLMIDGADVIREPAPARFIEARRGD